MFRLFSLFKQANVDTIFNVFPSYVTVRNQLPHHKTFKRSLQNGSPPWRWRLKVCWEVLHGRGFINQQQMDNLLMTLKAIRSLMRQHVELQKQLVAEREMEEALEHEMRQIDWEDATSLDSLAKTLLEPKPLLTCTFCLQNVKVPCRGIKDMNHMALTDEIQGAECSRVLQSIEWNGVDKDAILAARKKFESPQSGHITFMSPLLGIPVTMLTAPTKEDNDNARSSL